MSTRFRVTHIPGDRPLIEKRGDAEAIGREVAALDLLAGRPWVPALVDRGPGWMHSTRLPGAPRPLATIAESDVRRLGALVRELHEVRRGPRGGLWSWPSGATTLRDYRRRRAEDTRRMLVGTPDSGLALRAIALGGDDAPQPDAFCLVHGDLVESNIVWGPDGPALVDWEFWRMGDPAEDLAYLIETNAMPDASSAALVDAYGVNGIGARVDAWQALVAADAGAWYLAAGMRDEGERMLARARALVS